MEFDFTKLTSRKKIVTVLAFLTGLLHLLYGIRGIYPTDGLLDYFFILNFFGNVFFVIVLYFTPELEDYRLYFRWGFILYTLSSIVAYLVTYAPAGLQAILLPAGLFDKLLEIMLIVFLVIDKPLEPEERYDDDTDSDSTLIDAPKPLKTNQTVQ